MNTQNTSGFTLVEIAVVMVVIGLIIAGILKGQELITNAQVTATIEQMEEIQSAAQSFVDTYGEYAGNMANAEHRLLNCTAPPCDNGDGDNVLDVVLGNANPTNSEGAYFFNHLRAVEMLQGLDGSNVARFGAAFPTAHIGGGYQVGDPSAGAPTGFTAAELRAAPHLILMGFVANVGANQGALLPVQAERIDRTIDDGRPHRGNIIAQTLIGECRSAVTTYDMIANDQTCVIAYQLPTMPGT